MTKKTIICIAVRMKSQRLPRKALIDVAGKPFLQHLVERLSQAKMVDQIVVCTSTDPQDDELETTCKELGYNLYRGDPLDVLGRFIAAAKVYSADNIIRVTGDNIFADPTTIDRMVKAHNKHDADYTRTENMPLGITAVVMKRDMCEHLHARMDDPDQTEYMQLFTYNPNAYKCLVLEAPEWANRPDYS